MQYLVAKTELIDPAIDSPEWSKAAVEALGWKPVPSGRFPAPDTTFQLLRGPEGLSVRMHTQETDLRAVEEENGNVCADSCMEFFYKPNLWDTRYFNIEINPKGVMHFGVGCDRFNRTLILERQALSIQTEVTDSGWSVKYYIPDSLVEAWYPDLEALSRGNKSCVARANFYKCGGKTQRPHYASWAPINAQRIDFHIPDFFGQLVF